MLKKEGVGVREKRKREKKKKEREERQREKRLFGFVQVSKSRIYTLFGFFGLKSRFCVILIVFSIFNKYDAKKNFRMSNF